MVLPSVSVHISKHHGFTHICLLGAICFQRRSGSTVPPDCYPNHAAITVKSKRWYWPGTYARSSKPIPLCFTDNLFNVCVACTLHPRMPVCSWEAPHVWNVLMSSSHKKFNPDFKWLFLAPRAPILHANQYKVKEYRPSLNHCQQFADEILQMVCCAFHVYHG